MSAPIQRFLLGVSLRQSPCTFSTTKRFYGRWMHRKPSKVVLPYEENSLKTEHVINLDGQALTESREKHRLKTLQNTQNSEHGSIISKVNTVIKPGTKSKPMLPPEKSAEIKQRRQAIVQKSKEILSKLPVFDENNQVIYEKLKNNDSRLSSLLLKMKSKKDRARSGTILVEGWRLIMDGLAANCPLKYLIFSDKEDLNNIRPFLPKTGAKLFKIPYKEIQLWSDVETSSGLLGIFETPSAKNVKRIDTPLPLNIICDNIRIPGNLGAILRAAVGVGCDKLLLMKGCVDIWDAKVLRSAAGAHFRLPIHNALQWEHVPDLLNENTSVFVADSNSKVMLREGIGGNEGLTESLEGLHVPVIPYYSVEYSTLSSITLVIGGETEGISEECYRFVADRNGLRLNIPLQNGVDSLNTGMATAVIAFEIKKQLLEAKAKSAYIANAT